VWLRKWYDRASVFPPFPRNLTILTAACAFAGFNIAVAAVVFMSLNSGLSIAWMSWDLSSRYLFGSAKGAYEPVGGVCIAGMRFVLAHFKPRLSLSVCGIFAVTEDARASVPLSGDGGYQ
jgi:hypothetical protein